MSTSEATSTRPERETAASRAENGWDGRPIAAFVVRTVVFLAPLVAALAVSYTLATVRPRPTTDVGSILIWWVMLVMAGTVTMIVVDKVARKFLPLAALLRMTLVFPDEAPSRYGVALRSGTIKQLERRVEEIRQTSADATEAEGAEALLELAAALAQHDRFTRGHGERVRAYSAMIGAEMGLDKVEQSKLQWAGLIHDVGKLAVPSEILNKTGSLTDEEFEVIKTHPAEGMALIGPLAGWLGDWSLAVGEHHERWDGDGYPSRLAGEQISLAGRIVAVADVFDVITAARSYKKPQSPVLARQELADNAGTQFDPQVVRAFLNISLGQLRLSMWPLSWVANLPLIGPTVTAPASGLIATASLAVVTAVGGGALSDEAAPPEQLAAVVVEEDAVVNLTTVLPQPGGTTTTLVPADGGPFVEPMVDWSSDIDDQSSSTTTGPTGTAPSTTATTQPSSSTTTQASTSTSSTAATSSSTSTTAASTTTTIVSGNLTDCEAAQAGETNLVGADLVACDLSDLVLVGGDFRKADLTDADLSDSEIANFNMDGATLTDATLTGASFSDGSMVGVTADGVAGQGLRVKQVDMSFSTFTNGGFLRSWFENGSWANATLDDSSFTQSTFIGMNFTDAQAVGTGFAQSEHRNSSFTRITANGASFFLAVVRNSHLTDADFTDADFTRAELDLTDLTGADFHLLDLTRADMSTSSGLPINFLTADYHRTICPGGLLGQDTPCW